MEIVLVPNFQAAIPFDEESLIIIPSLIALDPKQLVPYITN